MKTRVLIDGKIIDSEFISVLYPYKETKDWCGFRIWLKCGRDIEISSGMNHITTEEFNNKRRKIKEEYTTLYNLLEEL